MSIKRLGTLPVLALLLIAWSPAQADVSLFDWGFSDDGTTYCKRAIDGCDNTNTLPAGMDASGFDFSTGLGSLSMTITGVGPHSMIAYFDHEIDEAINTFFNELGSTSGAAAAGQSWEIDEPGFFEPVGDIFDNFVAGMLDNTVGFPEDPNDVAMAMGFDFDLLEDETALVEFFLSTEAPDVDFYLAQTDPDSQLTIYFWGELTIRGPGGDVPEPGTLGLLGLGLLGLVGTRRLCKRAAS